MESYEPTIDTIKAFLAWLFESGRVAPSSMFGYLSGLKHFWAAAGVQAVSVPGQGGASLLLGLYSRELGHLISDYVRGMSRLRPQLRIPKRALLPSEILPRLGFKYWRRWPRRVQEGVFLLVLQMFFGWRASTVTRLRAEHLEIRAAGQ